MARTDSKGFTDSALNEVVRQVNGRIGNLTADVPPQLPARDPSALRERKPGAPRPGQKEPDIFLGETFAVWMLGADAVAASARNKGGLAKLAEPTGRYHHQIRLDNRGMAYARSMKMGDNKWSLRELRVSSLIAEKIQEAIEWCDKEPTLTDEYITRLLVVPAYHVYAFWFIHEGTGESKVFVITAPEQFTKLEGERLLGAAQFLGALRGGRVIAGFRGGGTLEGAPPMATGKTQPADDSGNADATEERGNGLGGPGPAEAGLFGGAPGWPVLDFRVCFPPQGPPTEERVEDHPGGQDLSATPDQQPDECQGGSTGTSEERGRRFGGGGTSEAGLYGGPPGSVAGGPPGWMMLHIRLFVPGTQPAKKQDEEETEGEQNTTPPQPPPGQTES